MYDKKKECKMGLLKELKRAMLDDMREGFGEELKGKKKVTVVADDAEGLKEGLSKAEEILQKRMEMMGSDEDDMLEMEEESEESEEKSEEMDDDSEEEMKKYEDGGYDAMKLKGYYPKDVAPYREGPGADMKDMDLYADGGVEEMDEEESEEIPMDQDEMVDDLADMVEGDDMLLSEAMERLPKELKDDLLKALRERKS